MKDCPYCGKENVKYNHKYSCKERPKDVPEEVISEELKVMPKNTIPCLICGEPAIKLNAIDMQCSKCGDYDTLAIKRQR
jgi:hypothetical protein